MFVTCVGGKGPTACFEVDQISWVSYPKEMMHGFMQKSGGSSVETLRVVISSIAPEWLTDLNVPPAIRMASGAVCIAAAPVPHRTPNAEYFDARTVAKRSSLNVPNQKARLANLASSRCDHIQRLLELLSPQFHRICLRLTGSLAM